MVRVFTLKQGAMSSPDVDKFVWVLVTLFIFFPAQEPRPKTSSKVFYKLWEMYLPNTFYMFHTNILFDVHLGIY